MFFLRDGYVCFLGGVGVYLFIYSEFYGQISM